MKKQFSLLWVVVMVLILGITVSAQETYSGTCGDNLKWELDGHTTTITITGNGEMDDYIINSPFAAPWWNNNCYNLITDIVIGADVTSIGDYAFANCIGLQKITFLGNAPEMGTDVFYGVNTAITVYYYEETTGWDVWENYSLVPISSGNDGPTTDNGNQTTPVSYTASLSTADTSVIGGGTLYVNIEVDDVFSASEIVISHSANLTYNSKNSTLNGAETTKTATGIKIADFGAEQSGGVAYTLAFTVDENTKKNDTVTVEIVSAAFNISENAANGNLENAGLTKHKISLTADARKFHVTLPEIFEGYSEVTEGETYTFRILGTDGEFYDYSDVKASVGGQSVTVTRHEDGTYTIENVEGDLVISGSRQPKEYKVIVTHPAKPEYYRVQYPETVSYGTNLILTAPAAEGYTIRLISAAYRDTGNGIAYSFSNAVDGTMQYWIDGSSITGDMYFVFDSTASELSVRVNGTGADDAEYDLEAVFGQEYVLTLRRQSAYEYTVSATVKGESVTLQEEGNTYTIPADNVTGTIVFTIEKTLKIDHVGVKAYASTKTQKLYRILYPAEKLDGKVYYYHDTAMFWSEPYSAYCTLVSADSMPEPSPEEFTLHDGKAEEISADNGDINNSGTVDANDAQFIYNMYMGEYDGFDTVPMIRYLCADVNSDGIVDTNDAVAIIHMILQNN